MRKNSFSVKNFILFLLFVTVMIISYLLYFGKNLGLPNSITFAGTLYILAFVLGLFLIKGKTDTFFSLMTFFWVSFFLFHGSQVVLYIIGQGDFESYNIFKLYQMESIIKATLYSTICEVFFCFGMLLNNSKRTYFRPIDIDEYIIVIRNFAKVMLLISVLPFVYYVLMILRKGITAGYGAINDYSNYGSSTLMKIITMFVDVFIIACFFALISYYKNKTLYRFFVCVISVYSVILLMLGERTEPTSLILLMIWLDSYLANFYGMKSRIKSKKLSYIVIVFVLIIIFPSIMALRHNGIIAITSLFGNIQKKGVFESFKESIAGIGASMMPLIEVRRFVSEGEPLRYGKTYIAACTNIVPYLGIAKKYASLSTWLMKQLNMRYGPGFSMAAEAYLNFGSIPISMIPFGFLFSKLLMWKKDDVDIRKVIRGMIFIITCLTLPRREISGRMRDIVYLVILLPIFIEYIYQRQREKRLD